MNGQMTWKENVRDGRNGRNKLRSYMLFKSDYPEEKYVSIILPRSHRSSYAKFRMGVAPLRLETGRYEQLEGDRRVCFSCPNEVVGGTCYHRMSSLFKFKKSFVLKNNAAYLGF